MLEGTGEFYRVPNLHKKAGKNFSKAAQNSELWANVLRINRKCWVNVKFLVQCYQNVKKILSLGYEIAN